MKSSSSNKNVILCLCRLGFDGLRCEKVTTGLRFPKFTSTGYLAFPERILNDQEFRLSIYVMPSTRMTETLLAFKTSALSNNFILGIEGNKFVFRFENSESIKVIRHQTLISTISFWYKVEIERKENNGRLFVNNIESTLSPTEIPKDSKDNYPQVTNKDDSPAGYFHCDYCLFLSGHPQLMSKVTKNHNLFGSIESAYIGCMRNLLINEKNTDMRRMPFYGKAVEGLGIEDCSEGLCDSIKCENSGDCQISADYEPTCHCNLGYSGKMCEKVTIIKMPFFTGDSYASYTGLRGTSKSQNHIFIRFKPLSATGILLYQGYSNNKRGDFLSIYLINGYPWISYDLGSGTISIRSAQSLSVNEWHTITFQRIGREGTLIVNGNDKITGYSPGTQVQLTIQQNLLLGGVDSLDNVSAFLSLKKGFSGCIQMLFLDNQQVHLADEIEKSRNLENCHNHTCGHLKNVCWQDGECVPDNSNFACTCRLGFIEANCQTQIEISGIRDPSFNGSSYLVYTDEKILKKLSDSEFNFSFILNLRKLKSQQFILHATRSSQPNIMHYFSLKINAKGGIDFILKNGVETIKMTLLDNLSILSDHKIRIMKENKLVRFLFNNTIIKTVNLPYNSLCTTGFSKLFVGGADLSTAISMDMPIQSGIVGCIKQIMLDSQDIRVGDANDGRSVAECGSPKAQS